MALSRIDIKYIKSLYTKGGRKKEKRFLAEGVRLLEEAVNANYLPERFFYAPADIGERGELLVKRMIERKIDGQSVSSRECERISDTRNSQGIVAMFKCRSGSLEQQMKKRPRRILVCDRIGDPGNLGTLMRSAAAFGFTLVITTAGSAEAENPKVVRAGMGAYFRLDFAGAVDDRTIAKHLKNQGYRLILADVKGKNVGPTYKFPEHPALILGSEASGAGMVFKKHADLRLRIPMESKSESLNSAMAGTILMHRIDSGERIQK